MKNNVVLVLAGGLLCCAVFLFAPKAERAAVPAKNNMMSACSCNRPRPVQPVQPTGSKQAAGMTKKVACSCQRPRPQQPTQPVSQDPYSNG